MPNPTYVLILEYNLGSDQKNPSQKAPTEWILLWILHNYSQPTKKGIKLKYFFRLLNFNFSHLLHIQLGWLEELVIGLINCLAFWCRNSYYIIRVFTGMGKLYQILHRWKRISLQRFLTNSHFPVRDIFQWGRHIQIQCQVLQFKITRNF